MIITFLIGNGFDLNIGLKTKYNDFMKKYAPVKNGDLDGVKKLKQSIGDYLKAQNEGAEPEINWSSAEEAFGKFTSEFIDVHNGDQQLSESHAHFCQEMAKYLSQEQERFPLKQISSDKDKLTQIVKDLRDVTNGLRLVDRNVINSVISNIGEGYTFNFLDFNYTNVLDNIIDALRENRVLGQRTYRNTNYENSIGTLIHVHGTTDFGMVFGVNDESQLNINIFKDEEPERKRQMIKPLFNEDMGEETDLKAFRIIENSHVIYVYGMSLGETDKRWWEEIGKFMKSNANAIAIVHQWEAPSVGLLPTPYTTYVRHFRDDFVRKTGMDPNDSQGVKNRLFVTNANIFKSLEGIANVSDQDSGI